LLENPSPWILENEEELVERVLRSDPVTNTPVSGYVGPKELYTSLKVRAGARPAATLLLHVSTSLSPAHGPLGQSSRGEVSAPPKTASPIGTTLESGLEVTSRKVTCKLAGGGIVVRGRDEPDGQPPHCGPQASFTLTKASWWGLKGQSSASINGSWLDDWGREKMMMMMMMMMDRGRKRRRWRRRRRSSMTDNANDDPPHRWGLQQYAACQSAAFMKGIGTFILGTAGFFATQKVLQKRLPYPLQWNLLLSVVAGSLCSYAVTRSETQRCSDLWVYLETSNYPGRAAPSEHPAAGL
ncbi:hypothetical protein Z043_101414, partial [Scleropages formosus]